MATDDFGFVPTPAKHEADDFGFIPSKQAAAPTPSNYWHQGIETGGKALGALAKFLDVPRALTVGPLSGEVIESGTGKAAYTAKDVLNALNPTNLERFPSNYEMMQRVGKRPTQLSDAVPALYGTPGFSPWYQPERGGALDPSTAGFVQAITDPVNLATFGEAAVAKEALEQGATRAALAAANKSTASKVLAGAGKAADVLAMPLTVPGTAISKAVRAVPVAGPALLEMGALPTTALGKLGSAAYSSLMHPVEDLGRKFGKKDVAQTFYDAGVKTPLGLTGKAGEAADVIMGARDQALSTAGRAGAELDIEQALKPAQEMVDKWRTIDHPNAQKLADAGQEVLEQYRAKARGTPAQPESIVQEASSILDMSGQPVMRDRVIPGAPAVPGKRMNPAQGSLEKTFASKQVPSNQYAEFAQSPEWGRFSKALAGGFRDEVENSVARTLGAKAGADVGELNASAGNLLSTRRGQLTAENQGTRLANRIVTPTGTDSVLVPLSMAGHGETAGLTALLGKHAIDAGRLATMPMGYALKNFAESTIGGPAFNAYLIQKLKEMTDNGKKER